MRLLILLVIVGVCLVSAKYLPDEASNIKQLLNRHKRSDSEDSLDDSSSNDTESISDEELKEQSKLHERIEKMRQKLLEKQEKERRRQEEAQQKLEERITKELQKEKERQQKEEERRQKELQKEEERREKELQKEEERRQKEEVKRLQELQKNEEKLEKERKKLEEQQKKLKEKALENERKQQEMLQKQLKEMEEETLQQEGDNNSSDSDIDESTELEDFWKSYIYSKYGLNESNTDLEKRIALRRYMQEELGLTVNSTESDRRQAILRLIESKWQAVSEQNALQSQMTDFVKQVGVQKIRAQLDKEIEVINNKTDTLGNVNLPWVPLAKENFAEHVSFLQTIKEFLASIVPNWYNESLPSTESPLYGAEPSENQNQNELESSLISSDISNKDDSISNINNSNNINTSGIPILTDNSGSTVAVVPSSSILDKNSPPAIGSDNSAFEDSVNIVGTNKPSLPTGTGVDYNTPIISGTEANNTDAVSTTVTGSAPDSALDVADVKSKNEVKSYGFSTDRTSIVVGTNTNGTITPSSEPTSNNLISNKDTSSSIISRAAQTPALASSTLGASPNGVQDSDDSVQTNPVNIANQDSILNSVSTTSDLTNNATPINELLSGKTITDDHLTSHNMNTIGNENKSDISQISDNASIKTDVIKTSPPTAGINDNLDGPAGKINGLSIDQDASVTSVPNNDLSNLVTKIISSIITTEASEVALPIGSDLEKKSNSDIPQSSAINAPETNNNQVDVLHSLLTNDYSNKENFYPSSTDSGFNIITSIGGETGIGNNVENNIPTASNIATAIDGAIYSSAASNNGNSLVITLPPALSTVRQDSAVSITNDITKTKSIDISTDPSTTESSNKIVIPNADFVHPIVDIAVNDKDKIKISSVLTHPIDKEIKSSNVLNISSVDESTNNEKTIIIPESTSQQPKTTDDVSINNLHLENVDVTSKVDVQNISKPLDVSKNQNPNEPLKTIGTIDLEHITSTVPGGTFDNHDIISSTLLPSAIVTEQVDDALKGANALNTNMVISTTSSTNSDDTISNNVTTKPDIQTTVLDQSTSVASDAQQQGTNNVTENHEKDTTLPNTAIPIITETTPNEVELVPTTSLPENGNNDIKEQENTIDNITVPVEHGASVIAVAQQ